MFIIFGMDNFLCHFAAIYSFVEVEYIFLCIFTPGRTLELLFNCAVRVPNIFLYLKTANFSVVLMDTLVYSELTQDSSHNCSVVQHTKNET
jgi:hypothetical protein